MTCGLQQTNIQHIFNTDRQTNATDQYASRNFHFMTFIDRELAEILVKVKVEQDRVYSKHDGSQSDNIKREVRMCCVSGVQTTKSCCIFTLFHCSIVAIFTALYGMPARTSYKKAVCLSLSVKRVDCDKTDEFQICPDFYIIRKII